MEGLLLACVRAALAGGSAANARELSADAWSGLRAAAERHLVQPLVWETLRDLPEEARMPGEVRDALRLEYHRTGLRNAFLSTRIAEVLAGAERRGIPLLLLKGAVLAYGIYPRTEHRGLGDVDLLVQERDFAGLREVLGELGYRTDAPRLPPRELPRYAHCYRQVRFLGPRIPRIEVHFRLLNLGIPPPEEPAWEDTEKVAFGEVQALAPSPERFLLHLCLHAQQHGFARLRLFSDLAVWQRARRTLDAERFAALARRHHLATAACYALTYTEELLGEPSVAGLCDRLRPPRWKARLFEALWHDRQVRALAVLPKATETELPRAFLLGEAGLADKLEFLLRVLFPPRAWLSPRETPRPRGWRGQHLRRVFAEAYRDLRGS